ncbi:MAG: hypothetical protein H6719_07360 [Sandaracinaceae bacterium]|nr:hypothetical protein [Sandaracinaceae bacterium]
MKLTGWVSVGFGLGVAIAGCGKVDTAVGCDDFGVDADAQKVEAFLDTGDRFATDSVTLANQVEATCRAVATDLGITPPMATRDQLQVEATCLAVRDEIELIIDGALPAGATLTLDFVPPVCTVDIDAYGSCVAECDANVSVDAQVMCEPGHLSGRCSGSCTGSCRVEGTVACDATCSGTCSGTCTGTCAGDCDGTCSATDAEGRCVGTCDGTCMGSCNATCMGMCEGSCIADVEGSCMGTCTGSCDVDFEAPRCEGDVDVMADVDCRAACDARVDATAQCTEPSVAVYFDGTIDPAGQERLLALITTLERNYPRLLQLQAQLTQIAESGATLVGTFDSASAAARRLGVRATACFVDATAVAVDSAATVDVTLSVTVEVTASASATAG